MKRSCDKVIENIIQPDPALVEAVELVKARENQLAALSAKRAEQRAVVSGLNAKLDELVIGSDTASAKQDCVNLAKRLDAARQLLDAIDISIGNGQNSVAIAKHEAAILTNDAIREAALQVEPEAEKNLVNAMQEFFTCYLAKSGSNSVSGAQHVLELMAQDRTLVKDAESRVQSVHQNLREAVGW